MIHGACPSGRLRSYLGIHGSFYLDAKATVASLSLTRCRASALSVSMNQVDSNGDGLHGNLVDENQVSI